MATALVRCGLLVSLFAGSIACDLTKHPITPSASLQDPVYPPLTGPSVTFAFSGPLRDPVRDFTATSRIVLYENGAVALDLLLPNESRMNGSYRQANTKLVFQFEGFVGGAEGTINGDSLEVRYDMRMRMTDFEDAVYQRTP